MTVIPRATLLANKRQLANGDIVGFVTRRPNLDYFHAGFVAFGDNGELLLRHASQSRASRARREHGAVSRAQSRALCHAAAAGELPRVA